MQWKIKTSHLLYIILPISKLYYMIVRRIFLHTIQHMPNFIISKQHLIIYSMDYFILIIIVLVILSLGMVITSIVILRNIKKTRHSPANTIKPIVDQLAAIHKDLDTIRRNSVNTERNIATIKNSINTITSSQVTDHYLSQILSLKRSWDNLSTYTGLLSKVRHLSTTDSEDILYRHIYSLVQDTEAIASQIKATCDISAQPKRRMLASLKIMYQGTILPIIEEVIPTIDTELQSTLDKLKKALNK